MKGRRTNKRKVSRKWGGKGQDLLDYDEAQPDVLLQIMSE